MSGRRASYDDRTYWNGLSTYCRRVVCDAMKTVGTKGFLTCEKSFSTKAFGPGPARDLGFVKLRSIKKNTENTGFFDTLS